jgi:hypothetical protein
MCDYSLDSVASRPAKVGDKLVTARFDNTSTRGFAAVGEPNVAVCLLPGTEIAFDNEVKWDHVFAQLLPISRSGKTGQKVARFRQVNLGNPHTHHDALEFADGQIMQVTCLIEGQQMTVLQLPASPNAPTGVEEAGAEEAAERTASPVA